jgi:hypothetical protein
MRFFCIGWKYSFFIRLNPFSETEEEKLMKQKYCLGFLILAVLLFAGCSGKRGPQGVAGTTECMQCHADDSNIRAIDAEWRVSVHASGNNINRNTPPCSRCHTGEGFIHYVSTGTPDTIDMPGLITCFACHKPHENLNFNLRASNPVTLENGGTFDKGVGNLCANCHMGRRPFPAIPTVPDSVFTISGGGGPFWGIHDGPQADLMSGQNAYVFAGTTYGNSPHATVVTNGCPTCHMAAPVGKIAGGHNMSMTYSSEGSEGELTAGCFTTGCHTSSSSFTFDYRGLQDSVSMKLDTLKAILVNDSLLTEGDLVNSPITVPAWKAGALYNYLFIFHDRSRGVHNSRYTLDVLAASIAALRAPE